MSRRSLGEGGTFLTSTEQSEVSLAFQNGTRNDGRPHDSHQHAIAGVKAVNSDWRDVMGGMKNLSTEAPIDLRELPAYGLNEAAHYLHIPVAILRSWINGRPRRPATRRRGTAVRSTKAEPFSVRRSTKPVIEVPDARFGALSFMNLVEAHVLNTIRFDYRFGLPKLRGALDHVRAQFGWKHPLAHHGFESDGMKLFIARLEKAKSISEPETLAIRHSIKTALYRIEHDISGMAMRFYPITRENGVDQPKCVVIDPLVSFGRPTITGTGITTSILANRYKAGDSIDALAEDYGCKQTEIEEALRCELGRSAWTADLYHRRDSGSADNSGSTARRRRGSKGLPGFILAWAGGWLRIAGEKGWVVLTKDSGIKNRRNEMERLLSCDARTFILAGNDLSGSEIGASFVKALPGIKKICAEVAPPFIAQVQRSGRAVIVRSDPSTPRLRRDKEV